MNSQFKTIQIKINTSMKSLKVKIDLFEEKNK